MSNEPYLKSSISCSPQKIFGGEGAKLVGVCDEELDVLTV